MFVIAAVIGSKTSEIARMVSRIFAQRHKVGWHQHPLFRVQKLAIRVPFLMCPTFLHPKSCSPNSRMEKSKRYPYPGTANNYHLRNKVLMLSGLFETFQLARSLSSVFFLAALASSLTVCAVSHPISHAFLRSPVLIHVEMIVSPTWSVDCA